MDMSIFRSSGLLSRQPRGIPVADVWVLGIKQVQHVQSKAHPAKLPIGSQVHKRCWLRSLRAILDQRSTCKMPQACR